MTLKHILVVDDNEGIRSLLFEFLKLEGYSVGTASNGFEALEKVQAQEPSLILLDIKMAGMNGIEVFEKVRKMVPGLPVVLMSAYTELQMFREIFKDEPSPPYLSKPFNLEDVRKLVNALLDKHRKSKAISAFDCKNMNSI